MEKKKCGSQGGPNKGGMKIFRKLPQMKVDECLINLVSTLVLQFVWISLKFFYSKFISIYFMSLDVILFKKYT